MKHRPDVGLLLAHRLRRWPNSEPTLDQCLMFAGMAVSLIGMERRWDTWSFMRIAESIRQTLIPDDSVQDSRSIPAASLRRHQYLDL